MTLPKILVDYVRDGQVVLFLGAGASIGARHPQNRRVPTSSDLASLLADKFLGPSFRGWPLPQVAELAISETDLLSVQEYVASLFRDFQPSETHLQLPTFVWKALATTNFDLLIERAYEAAKSPLQVPVVFMKNGERVEERLRAPNSMVFLKLHGCITDINDPAVPLILTPEQYITHKRGRDWLFERLQSLAFEYPILFVGHSLADIDIRTIILDLSRLGDARPRYYVVAPNISEEEKRFWEARRISALGMTFDDLMRELNAELPVPLRPLSTLLTTRDHPITSRLTIPPGAPLGQSLSTFLRRDAEYISKDTKPADIDPAAFYHGYFTDLSPILLNLDVRRSITDEILTDVFLSSEEERRELCPFYVIKGHAGSGKSVLMKRLAWEAAVDYDKLCVALKPAASPDFEPLAELIRLSRDRVFLFADPVTEFVDLIESFLRRARKEHLPLTIIGAERDNEWNTDCEALEPYLTDAYEVRNLSEREIKDLLELLAKHKSLGFLADIPFEKQKEALAIRAGRQLLVALHEATLGKPFTDIVFDEVNSIASPIARTLYITICVLHRLGVPVRAGLISRVHGIPFSEFRERLFSPLEHVVFTRFDDNIRDYVYLSRHPHIAEIVFERVLATPQERYDEYIRLLACMDIDFNSDREAFKGLTSARQLMHLFPDPIMIRNIYRKARDRVGDLAMLLQQAAIFEMNSPGGSLSAATELLQLAHRLAPHYKPVSHSLSVLALRKAQRSQTQLEKSKNREESRHLARKLISEGSATAHPYHTLIQISLDELVESGEPDSASFEKVVKETQELIARAEQAFPDDSVILETDARFSEHLGRHAHALEALERAFAANRGSPYLASRLARMHESRGELQEAANALRQCLEVIPYDKHANFALARLLMTSPGANDAEVMHHLRHSFTDGDSNYQAQFWYARLSYIRGDVSEADRIWRKLNDANIDLRIKRMPRGVVREGGESVQYRGTIVKLETSYAFVRRDDRPDPLVFSHIGLVTQGEWEVLAPQARVTFSLGFNYRGPVALDLRRDPSPADKQ